MVMISIRLPESLLHEINVRAKSLHIQRTQYIRQAIEKLNQELLSQERKQHLANASLKIRRESMKVNAEFERGCNCVESLYKQQRSC